MRLIFIDLLHDHPHEILDVISLCGLVRFALIGEFLGTWRCGSMTPFGYHQCRQYPSRVAARDECEISPV